MTHRRLPIRRSVLLSAALAGVPVLVAIEIPEATAASTQALRISARPHMILRFNTGRLHAHPGRVTILMSDPSNAGMSHGIAIAGHGVGPVVKPGHTSSVTATFRKGSYTYYCPVAGHRAAGMQGTLVVS